MRATRVGLIAFVLLLPAASSWAQVEAHPTQACTPVVREVIISMADGGTAKDTLLCMSPSDVTLVRGGVVALDRVRRIEEPGDGIVDGVLKGAALGLVFLVFCVNDCDTGVMLRATAAYAAVGGIIDALDRNRKPIYRRGAAVAWRVRF